MVDRAWDGRLDLTWGGETRRFELRIGELRMIEADTSHGIVDVMQRIAARKATIGEVRAVIRYALEGGGEHPGKVALLMERYFDQAGAWAEQYAIAADVLQAALFLPRELQDGSPGKGEGDGGGTTGASPSP